MGVNGFFEDGIASIIAGCSTHPLDLIKVRMQLQGEEPHVSKPHVSNPVDVIKTRVMKMKVEAGFEPPYKGAVDCVVNTVRADGPMALYKGFIPTISRQGPFTVVVFVILEQVRKLLKNF